MSLQEILRPSRSHPPLSVPVEPVSAVRRASFKAPWAVAIIYVVALALATLVMVAAYASARHSTGQLHFLLFWVAYATAFVSTLWVGTRPTTGFAWRLATLVGFGTFTFVPKFLMSTSGPVYYDEYGHWRHANDIAASGHVDASSSFLPILRYYPGLDALTAGLHRVTGLSTWHAGQLVVLVAHCAVLVTIVYLTRALGYSARAGVLAALVYSLNSSYMYFETDFSYESLGLPLAFLTVAFVVAARRATTQRRAAMWSLVALVTGAMTIVTHHISAAAMIAVLVLVAAFVSTTRPGALTWMQWAPFAVTAVLAVGFIWWVLIVAPSTYAYLTPHVGDGLRQLGDLVTGRQAHVVRNGHTGLSTRHVPFAGNGAPPYEVLAAFAAPVIAAVATFAAVVQAWRDRHNVQRLAVLAPFFLLTCVYFVSLPLVLTASGGEASHRTWAYSYLGVAVLAVSAAPTWRRWTGRVSPQLLRSAFVAGLLVVAMGNVAAGLNVTYRFPGPYQFGTDTRSRTAESMQVVRWAAEHAPAGSTVVTDRFTGEVVTGYSRLQVPAPSQSWVYQLYKQGDAAAPSVRGSLAAAGVRFWILDTRIGTLPPQQPLFVSYYGPGALNIAALRTAGTQGTLLHLVHRTDHYEIFSVTP